MTATNLTASIANIAYPVLNTTYTLDDKTDERSTLQLTILDANNTYSFLPFQPVTITDTLEGIRFTGFVSKPIATKYDANNALSWQLACVDNEFLAGKKTSNRVINNQYAGVAAASMVNDYLSQDGVVANYAVRDDNNQLEFAQGTLNGTLATSNLGGDLELALAGSVVNVVESTTSNFGTGSLNNTNNSSNTLLPVATNAIRIQGTESLTSDPNAYFYIKIWTGSVGIVNGRYIEYDIWIDSSSPNGTIGVDFVCTDGTTWRDNATNFDLHNLPPHPKTDISGYAFDQWYHRKFLLDNLVGKTIAYVTVAIEGDAKGTYTGYVKNLFETDGAGTVINTFYGGSFNVNPPKQLSNNGYSAISCTSVPTYDCTSQTTNRVSSSYNVSNVNLLKSSFLTYKTTLPANTGFTFEYSIDGGNSYTLCTSDPTLSSFNGALPNLPAGLSLSGKSIQFRETFLQNAGANPEQPPKLNSVQLVLNPTYTASKSDVYINATTNAQWNAGTLSNTQSVNNALGLLGAVRNWHGADMTNMVVFGDGATGPGPTTVKQLANYDAYWLVTGINMEGHARLDFVGSWGNGLIECDVYFDRTDAFASIEYRRTADSNFDANYAYAVQFALNTISLQRGSNSSAGSTGTRTQVATAAISLSTAGWHHVKIIFNGSNHQVFVEEVPYINATDGTYTAAGHVSFRTSNANVSQGYQGQFNNFGITVIGLSGTWLSPSTSLSAAGTFGGAVVSWQDVSIGSQSTSILVESTTNGGSSWQTVTNGGSIASLTLGQSLSGVNLQLRVTLTTASASSMPQIQGLVCKVLGGFSSSGTRIAPFLPLSNALIAGSTLTSWVATTPANTSVAVATSLNGTSYSSATNGGQITGITSQPSPTLDTFSSNSSPNYTSTFASGGSIAPWFWDTLNSILSVTGGSLALLLYNSISASNVDLIVDMDQTDTGGIVWRVVDVNNYYQIIVGDASSSSDQNNISLVKRVSGTRNFLASGSIAFVRGTKRRMRVTMSSGLITVYFDGVWVLSYIDPSPLGAGKVGISHDSGTSRFYNFRVQPQGDSLSNKVVYSKVTLGSTDPLLTPQLTGLTVAALHPNIGLGSLIPNADYTNTYVSDNIKDLAKKSDYTTFIDQNLNFVFGPRVAQPAPWILQSADQQLLIAGPLTVDYSADLYRNEMVLQGVVATGTKSETKIGDGTTTSWALGGELIATPIILLNNQAQTVGVKGIDVGKNFYWTPGSNAIDQDPSGTVLQQTDTLLFQNYTYQYITSITVDNTNLAGTVTQKQFAQRMGRTFAIQNVYSGASSAHTASSDAGDLDVSKCRRIAVDINITAVSGSSPTIQFFVDRKDANGIYYNLWSSSVTNATGQISTTIGAFATINQALGAIARLRWTITGSTPSFTFSASVTGILDVQSAGLGIVAVVEDVSSQSLNVAAATAYGNTLLQRYGVQGRLITCKTWRRNPSLAIGQYIPVFIPEHNINDASMLITEISTTQDIAYENGTPTQLYWQMLTLTESANVGSAWKLLSSTLK